MEDNESPQAHAMNSNHGVVQGPDRYAGRLGDFRAVGKSSGFRADELVGRTTNPHVFAGSKPRRFGSARSQEGMVDRVEDASLHSQHDRLLREARWLLNSQTNDILKYRAELQKRPRLDGIDLGRMRTFGPSSINMRITHEDGANSQFTGLEDMVRYRQSVGDERWLIQRNAIELESRRIRHRQRDAGLTLLEISFGDAGRPLHDDEPEVFKREADLRELEITIQRQEPALGARQQATNCFRLRTEHRR